MAGIESKLSFSRRLQEPKICRFARAKSSRLSWVGPSKRRAERTFGDYLASRTGVSLALLRGVQRADPYEACLCIT